MSKTINLATKYSDKVQERFYQDSLTESSFDKSLDMEFTGVKTVVVYETDVAPLNDYTRSGSNRYGTPTELADNVYEFTMNQDKSFVYTIDKGNAKEQLNIKKAGETLRREMREVVTPYIDKYRIAKWTEQAGQHVALANAPSTSNIVGFMLDAGLALDNKFVPREGRTYYVTGEVYKLIKTSTEWLAVDNLAEKALAKGVVGYFDGTPVKRFPASYMHTNAYFLLVHKNAAISPMKLKDYKIHTDPVGISGDLVEGRVLFDAFVKPTKADGIYVAAKSGTVCTTPTVAVSSGTVTVTLQTGETGVYTTDGSDPRFSPSALTYNASSKPTIAAGESIKVAATKTGSFWSGVAEAAYA